MNAAFSGVNQALSALDGGCKAENGGRPAGAVCGVGEGTGGEKTVLNKIVIMGRLVRDPDLRRTQAGTAVAAFTLAVERDFKDAATGERTADFIDCVAWRQTGEFVSRYFTKGRMAIVEAVFRSAIGRIKRQQAPLCRGGG